MREVCVYFCVLMRMRYVRTHNVTAQGNRHFHHIAAIFEPVLFQKLNHLLRICAVLDVCPWTRGVLNHFLRMGLAHQR